MHSFMMMMMIRSKSLLMLSSNFFGDSISAIPSSFELYSNLVPGCFSWRVAISLPAYSSGLFRHRRAGSWILNEVFTKQHLKAFSTIVHGYSLTISWENFISPKKKHVHLRSIFVNINSFLYTNVRILK